MKDLPRNPKRKYLKHDIPSWVFEKSHNAYFITICCKDRYSNQLCNSEVWPVIEESMRRRQGNRTWFCSLFLTMPDHVHGIFRFNVECQMEPTIRDWKKWISRNAGVQWQRGFFDHRIRSDQYGTKKREYILDNPIRGQLISNHEDWKYKIDFINEIKRNP